MGAGCGVRGRQGFNLGDSIITLQIGIHGVPVDMPDGVYRDLGSAALSGYWRYSMNDRDEHYYKRVYTGCARAVDFLCSLPEFDGKTIGVTGGQPGRGTVDRNDCARSPDSVYGPQPSGIV